MRAVTRKTKSFPGDTWIGIDVIDDQGRRHTAFGVWRRRDRAGSYYESDGGGIFRSLAEAKGAALAKFSAKNPQVPKAELNDLINVIVASGRKLKATGGEVYQHGRYRVVFVDDKQGRRIGTIVYKDGGLLAVKE
jgi:hypothetical protein